jgi:uncharacterized membrane-anchored protein
MAIEKTLGQAPGALGKARTPRQFLDKLRSIAEKELSVALKDLDKSVADTIKAAYKDALESLINRVLGTAKDYAIAGFTGATGIKIWESLFDKPGGNGDSKKTKLPSPEQLRNLANELEAKRSSRTCEIHSRTSERDARPLDASSHQDVGLNAG